MFQPEIELAENVLLGVRFGQTAAVHARQGGQVAERRGDFNAVVERHEIRRLRATAGKPARADHLGVHFRAGLQVVDPTHTVPDLEPVRVVSERHAADAEQVVRVDGDRGIRALVLEPLTLIDRVENQRRHAVEGQQSGNALVIGVPFAVRGMPARNQNARPRFRVFRLVRHEKVGRHPEIGLGLVADLLDRVAFFFHLARNDRIERVSFRERANLLEEEVLAHFLVLGDFFGRFRFLVVLDPARLGVVEQGQHPFVHHEAVFALNALGRFDDPLGQSRRRENLLIDHFGRDQTAAHDQIGINAHALEAFHEFFVEERLALDERLDFSGGRTLDILQRVHHVKENVPPGCGGGELDPDGLDRGFVLRVNHARPDRLALLVQVVADVNLNVFERSVRDVLAGRVVETFDGHRLLKVQRDPVRRVNRGIFKPGVPVGVQIAVAGAVRLVARVLAVHEDLDFADVGRDSGGGRVLSLCALKRRGESAERQGENQKTVGR